MELIQEPTPSAPAPDKPLAVEVLDVLLQDMPSALADDRQRQDAAAKMAANVVQLLLDRGHYLPGMPPAERILQDAKSFAERLTLSNLALRILNMLAWTALQTPETKPARKWLDDYLEGRNHGPVGKPMLWPAQLPGLASLLREWGFQPTPTMPPYVARATAPTLVS